MESVLAYQLRLAIAVGERSVAEREVEALDVTGTWAAQGEPGATMTSFGRAR
jgi:hypothetical protein